MWLLGKMLMKFTKFTRPCYSISSVAGARPPLSHSALRRSQSLQGDHGTAAGACWSWIYWKCPSYHALMFIERVPTCSGDPPQLSKSALLFATSALQQNPLYLRPAFLAFSNISTFDFAGAISPCPISPPLRRAILGKMPAHSTASQVQYGWKGNLVVMDLNINCSPKWTDQILDQGFCYWLCHVFFLRGTEICCSAQCVSWAASRCIQGAVRSWKLPRWRLAKESVLFSWHLGDGTGMKGDWKVTFQNIYNWEI